MAPRPGFRGVGGVSGIWRKGKRVLQKLPKVVKPKAEKKVVVLSAITELIFTPVCVTFQVDSAGIGYNIRTSFESEFIPVREFFSTEVEISFVLSYGGGKVEYDSRTEALKKDDEDVIFAFLMAVGE